MMRIYSSIDQLIRPQTPGGQHPLPSAFSPHLQGRTGLAEARKRERAPELVLASTPCWLRHRLREVAKVTDATAGA